MKLNHSKVEYREAEHEYWLGNIQLQGITGILRRQLFSDKYSGIPEGVLAKAAEYGSRVHADIEICDALDVNNGQPHIVEYLEIKKKHNLVTIENEYLVSDNINYASPIDLIFEGYDLADIKTTSKLDKEYVSWQLSIYAYLFELQNPGLKAGNLYALWLPKPRYGKPKLVGVDRIASPIISKLLECDARGEQFLPT